MEIAIWKGELNMLSLGFFVRLEAKPGKEKEVVAIVIDPNLETADINTENNSFPKKQETNKFDQLKKEK